MPLIIICGTPVSGKTSRTNELKEFFEKKHGKRVDVVSEEEAIISLGYEKNSTYLDSQKEKRVRGHLKSEVIRLIGKDSVVILDGSNYIKGKKKYFTFYKCIIINIKVIYFAENILLCIYVRFCLRLSL